jgi:hypothetical protein
MHLNHHMKMSELRHINREIAKLQLELQQTYLGVEADSRNLEEICRYYFTDCPRMVYMESGILNLVVLDDSVPVIGRSTKTIQIKPYEPETAALFRPEHFQDARDEKMGAVMADAEVIGNFKEKAELELILKRIYPLTLVKPLYKTMQDGGKVKEEKLIEKLNKEYEIIATRKAAEATQFNFTRGWLDTINSSAELNEFMSFYQLDKFKTMNPRGGTKLYIFGDDPYSFDPKGIITLKSRRSTWVINVNYSNSARESGISDRIGVMLTCFGEADPVKDTICVTFNDVRVALLACFNHVYYSRS